MSIQKQLSASGSLEVSEEVMRVKQRFSIIGNSMALVNAIERAVKVASIDLSVLVSGESGAGKEFFPQIIHQFGSRKHKKYIAVNCGAIPEGTIDSELFGHEKGAFTGAVATRKGYFEEADGGTIFLDEVAELPLTTQARLLRVLESGEFLKVGSSVVQKTNVRIVAATNVDLLRAVSGGKFREDLYYRLSTVVIDVPALHDRGDDILLLARKFASDFSRRYMTAPISFSAEAVKAMMVYRWPGNVRQLKNIVEQLALFSAGEEVGRDQIMDLLPRSKSSAGENMPSRNPHSYEMEREYLWQSVFALRREIADLRSRLDQEPPTEEAGPYSYEARSKSLVLQSPGLLPVRPARSLEESEREAVADALRRCGGNKKLAAEQLDISQRTLYRKIREYNLDTSQPAEIGEEVE